MMPYRKKLVRMPAKARYVSLWQMNNAGLRILATEFENVLMHPPRNLATSAFAVMMLWLATGLVAYNAGVLNAQTGGLLATLLAITGCWFAVELQRAVAWLRDKPVIELLLRDVYEIKEQKDLVAGPSSCGLKAPAWPPKHRAGYVECLARYLDDHVQNHCSSTVPSSYRFDGALWADVPGVISEQAQLILDADPTNEWLQHWARKYLGPDAKPTARSVLPPVGTSQYRALEDAESESDWSKSFEKVHEADTVLSVRRSESLGEHSAVIYVPSGKPKSVIRTREEEQQAVAVFDSMVSPEKLVPYMFRNISQEQYDRIRAKAGDKPWFKYVPLPN